MTNILELLKNEKVEWKKLGEVFNTRTGYTPSKKVNEYWENGTVDWFTIDDIRKKGRYLKQANVKISDKAVKKELFKKNSIILSIIGTIGEYALIDTDFVVNQQFMVFTLNKNYNDSLNVDFIKYYFSVISEYCKKNIRQSSVPTVDSDGILRQEIPIPSLETQEKIVEILDKFTSYVTELQSELQSRAKQYTYYRDMLLSEEYLNKVTKEMEEDRRVKIVQLDEVIKIKNGKDWKELEEGDIPVYGSGGEMGVYVSKYAYDKPTVLIPRKGSIKNVFYIETPFWNVDTIFYTEIDESKLIPKYFYYFIEYFDLSKLSENSTRPSLTQSTLKALKFPLPSLSLQNKIVRILDKFQVMLADTKGLLPEEIAQRQKQYEYYREKLLTFDKYCDSTHARTLARTLILSSHYYDLLEEVSKFVDVDIKDKVEKKMLKDIGEFINGSGMPKTTFDEKGEVGAIHYGHIYTNYNLFVISPIVKVNKEISERLKKVNYGDIVIAKTSENIEDIMKSVAYLGKEEAVVGGHTAVYKHKQNPKYLSYVFNGSIELIKQKNRLARGVKVIEISSTEMGKIVIPLPPLHVQQHIVSILDKFDTLVNDIKEGLPKEIELRQKQYEYWREQLLSFNR